jgi:hypothetical protein
LRRSAVSGGSPSGWLLTTNSSTLGECAIFYPREQSEKGFVRLGSEIGRTVDQRFKLIARLAEITPLAALNQLSPKPTAGGSAGSWCRAERWLIESEGRLMLLTPPLWKPHLARRKQVLARPAGGRHRTRGDVVTETVIDGSVKTSTLA